MKGLILVNAYSRMRAFEVQSSRMKEALEALGAEVDIRRNDSFIASVEGGSLRADVDGYDFCLYLDKDRYVLKALEDAGLPVFNSFSSIEACDDKMATCLALAGRGFRMPRTLPGPLCYERDGGVKESIVEEVAERLGFPVVVKECYGSMGKGVRLARNMDELRDAAEAVRNVPHMFQEFVASSFGRDLRVIVIGGKALGGMLRRSGGDFRSNIGCGGSGEPFELSPEIASYAERIAETLGLEYCGIDLLFPEDGDMIVCEVNSNAFFEAFEECTGVDVAGAYARRILEAVSERL